MPELPEVETIKNELLPLIIGRRITDVTVVDTKATQKLPSQEFRSGLIGQSIISLERRGKYLIFHLSGGRVLIIHLRMTGSLLFDPEGKDKYARIILRFEDGHSMVFTDRRRLGVVYLTEDENQVVGRLGIEPLNSSFTAAELAKRLKGRTAPIKALLLDQSIIAGLGNMYADEALFAARIHPLKRGGELSSAEIKRLHRSIIEILSRAIENKGASVDTYKRPDGGLGTAHNEFKVAHRLGEKCPVCGTPIERIVIRNRGSYFCPKCQRLR